MIGTISQVDMLAAMLARTEWMHRIASHNIANVNTPGYQTLEARFDSSVKRVEAGPPSSAPEIVGRSDLPERLDGNNVDIESELARLTQVALQHQTYTQILASKLSMLRLAISPRT